jgi:hypothetical protein
MWPKWGIKWGIERGLEWDAALRQWLNPAAGG